MTRLAIDVAILSAHFVEKQLARVFAAAFDRTAIGIESQRLALNPLPGKRLKSMSPDEHALLLARTALGSDKNEKLAKQTLAALVAKLPKIEGGAAAPADLEALRPEPFATRVDAFLRVLTTGARHDELKRCLDNGFLDTPIEVQPEIHEPPRDPELVKAEHRITKLEHELATEREKASERDRGYRARIDQLQLELTELQQRLGVKHRECEELASNYEQAKTDTELAFRRAARFKQQLDEMKAPGERERELRETLAREARRAEIEASKVEILEYQLDLHQLVEEETPQRQSVDESAPIRERVLKFVAKFGVRPKVLIVGGAGKQRAHRERDFELLKSRLEIEGEWRFADYGSWHRDLPRLRNDIQHRFDLVFVLHWNRTTFVQKMHDEARSLNGRVRTVPYRGFLSLERAVAEEVDRFVQERI